MDRIQPALLTLGILTFCSSQVDARSILKSSFQRLDLRNRMIHGLNGAQVNNVLDGATQAYHIVEKTVKWFQRLKKEVKDHTPMSLRYNNSELTNMEMEIYTCKPVDEEEQCFSPCVFTESSEYYRWCYIDSKGSTYRSCTCKIRPSILKFLIMKKREMMGLVPSKELTGLEIALLVALAISITVALGFVLKKMLTRRHPGQGNAPLVADMLPAA